MSLVHHAGRIGLVCNPDHEVFAAVAAELEARGFEVAFLEPSRPVEPATIASLDLLANKKVTPASFRALRDAERLGVPTWNGATTMLLGARLVGLRALEAVGFAVPATTLEPPATPYVAKPRFDWLGGPDPVVNGAGDVYQPLLPAAPVDDKYYGVDDGDRVHVRALRSRSKLYGEKEPLAVVEPDPAVAEKVRALMAKTDAQAIGVDVIWSRGEPVAVDVNPSMSCRHVGLEPALADSMAARVSLPLGANYPRPTTRSPPAT